MRIKIVGALLGLGLNAGAWASGFNLLEQNASGLGNAYAGQAASAQDASTVFFNPAGLLRIEGEQVVVVGHLIRPSVEFTDQGSTAPIGNGGDIGGLNFVPNAYYARDVGPGWKFGLGINSPFGLKNEYDNPWAGRSQALLSDLKTININPSLAWLFNDKIALGAGINLQWVQAELSQRHPTQDIVTMKADDTSWGYNLGALIRFDNNTRVGIAYRSSIEHKAEGDVRSVVGTSPDHNGPVMSKVKLPDSASLSLFSRMDDRWDLLADLTWTGWQSFDRFKVDNLATGVTITNVPQNWDDTWRVSVGANYRKSDKWLWRMGVAYDQGPVPDAEHRTPRIPDGDRIWLAFGGQYKISDKGWVDFGYAHLFVETVKINHIETVLVKGEYKGKVDILSAQYTHTF
ncbi:MAG: outer membrane protein transport protein [Hydrogenophilaceae bacterium]|nr:outer membrane protein transport protein [Hydrogenophilaceae bacterium]